MRPAGQREGDYADPARVDVGGEEMKAEIHIIDDNGERVASKPTLIEPVDIQDNGFCDSVQV